VEEQDKAHSSEEEAAASEEEAAAHSEEDKEPQKGKKKTKDDDEELIKGEGEGETQEYYDSEASLQRKVHRLAELIRVSKHVVIHTGAGISTSASIPDFRGPTGVWTMKDKGQAVTFNKDMADVTPTYTHLAIVGLLRAGHCKYVVSQNIDGLHLRSGIDKSLLSELHGNCFLEVCSQCGRRYLRDFSATQNDGDEIDFKQMTFTDMKHVTGRRCVDCKGILKDTIINFGENLPQKELKRADKHSKKADLSLVLGTSLRVTPAADLPMKSQKVVVVNLQETKVDKKCEIRIFAKTDEVMRRLMEELKVEIPEWTAQEPSAMRKHYKAKEAEKQKHMEQIRLDAEKRYKEEMAKEAAGTAGSTPSGSASGGYRCCFM